MTEDDSITLSLVIGGTIVACWRVLLWLQAPIKLTRPRSDDVEAAIQDPECSPLCIRCLCPQDGFQWFCQHCNAAVGPYNNSMEYLYLFSQGEVFRAGTQGLVPARGLTVIGYLLASFCAYQIFAPLYWVMLFRGFRQRNQNRAEDSNATTDIDIPGT